MLTYAYRSVTKVQSRDFILTEWFKISVEWDVVVEDLD